MTIKKEGGEFVLRAKGTGKVLGRHKTRAEAVDQERAVQAAKRSRQGPKRQRRR